LGRARAFEAIVKGVDIPEATVPESFRVLIRELNALSLSIEAKGSKHIERENGETSKEGEKLVATKELTSPKGPMEVKEVKKV
jgi:DNA-directed RNA polymerase subunit beta